MQMSEFHTYQIEVVSGEKPQMSDPPEMLCRCFYV